jgi:hypothetical protein
MYEVLIALEWTPAAAKAAIDHGGLTDVDCFINLKEKDISEFVITIRKVPVPVGAMQKLYFSWLCWVARHHARIGREISWGDVSVAWIVSFRDQWELEDEHVNPEIVIPKATTAALKDPALFLENIIEGFDRVRSPEGVKMSYLLREKCIPDDGETFGHADSPYESHDDELTQRYPILSRTTGYDHTKTDEEREVLMKEGPFNPKFLRDNKVLFAHIRESFITTEIWNHASGFKRSKDGYGACTAIFNFLLGDDHSKAVADKAELVLTTMTYDGESKAWDLNKHITKFAGQVNILSNLEERGLYRGNDKPRLTEWLLKSIKTDIFDASKNTILDSETLKNDWKKAAAHLSKFLEANPDLKRNSGPRGSRKIAEIKKLRGGGKGKGFHGMTFSEAELKKAMKEIQERHNLQEGVKNFFIPIEEYSKYDHLHKQAIWRLRHGKGGKGPGKPAPRVGGNETVVSEVTQVSEVATLAGKVDTLTAHMSKISKVVRKMYDAEAAQMARSDSEDMFCNLDSDLDGEASVASSAGMGAGASKKRRTGNRGHNALSIHPSPGRQGGF